MGDESRIRSFKNKGKDSEVSIFVLRFVHFHENFEQEMRRRRIGQTVELRKAKKEDQLLKRRNISIQDEDNIPPQESNIPSPNTMTAEEIIWGKNINNRIFKNHVNYAWQE
jgi:importin subunit alpha-2